MNSKKWLLGFSLVWVLPGLLAALVLDSRAAVSGVKPDQVFTAEAKKSKTYIGNGVIVGGDWAIDDFTVSGIRRAANAGYERIVVDLEGSRGGEPAAVDRPPYYHVAISPESRKVTVTIMGKAKVGLDPTKISAAFKKSNLVTKVDLLPLVEKDRWTFVLNLKRPGSIEVFELAKPTRIILDLQSLASKGKVQALETPVEN